jgi:hypothetical protein
MGNESAPERDDRVHRADPLKASSWRSALVVDLAGRIRVTRRRALGGTRERLKLDQEAMPAAGPEWSTRFPG